jgi:hypothetical protein
MTRDAAEDDRPINTFTSEGTSPHQGADTSHSGGKPGIPTSSMPVSNDIQQTRLQTTHPKIKKAIERILLASGIIGIIGIDQDIIRWSALVHWIVVLYNFIADYTKSFLARWLSIDLSPLLVDVIFLSGTFLAAANAHSFRRYRTFTLLFSLRLLYMEQIVQRSSDHIWSDAQSQKEQERIAYIAAWLAVLMAYASLFVVLFSFISRYDASLLVSVCAFLYLVGGFGFINHLDDKVAHNTKNLHKDPQWRTLALSYVVFLPSAVVRYVAFFAFTVLFSMFMAWRLYVIMFLVISSLLMINELYLRFVYDWGGRHPDCWIYSIKSLCPGAWPAPP